MNVGGWRRRRRPGRRRRLRQWGSRDEAAVPSGVVPRGAAGVTADDRPGHGADTLDAVGPARVAAAVAAGAAGVALAVVGRAGLVVGNADVADALGQAVRRRIGVRPVSHGVD